MALETNPVQTPAQDRPRAMPGPVGPGEGVRRSGRALSTVSGRASVRGMEEAARVGGERFKRRLTAVAGIGILAAAMGVVTSSGAAASPGARPDFKRVPAGSKITNLPAGL